MTEPAEQPSATIGIERVFRARVDDVFDAWTSAEELLRWCGIPAQAESDHVCGRQNSFHNLEAALGA